MSWRPAWQIVKAFWLGLKGPCCRASAAGFPPGLRRCSGRCCPLGSRVRHNQKVFRLQGQRRSVPVRFWWDKYQPSGSHQNGRVAQHAGGSCRFLAPRQPYLEFPAWTLLPRTNKVQLQSAAIQPKGRLLPARSRTACPG